MRKENRLKKRKQFNWTFKNGTSVHSKDLVLIYTSSWAKDYKVGFSVTKKVGKAVVRNKVKRRLREILTKLDGRILPKHTLVFVAKSSIVEAEFLEIEKQVELLLKKANLIKELWKNFWTLFFIHSNFWHYYLSIYIRF